MKEVGTGGGTCHRTRVTYMGTGDGSCRSSPAVPGSTPFLRDTACDKTFPRSICNKMRSLFHRDMDRRFVAHKGCPSQTIAGTGAVYKVQLDSVMHNPHRCIWIFVHRFRKCRVLL